MPTDIREPWNLVVSDEALLRMKERFPDVVSGHSNLWIAARLRELAHQGNEWVLKPEWRVKQLLAHHCKDAIYVKAGKVLIVIEDHVIVTCHAGTADRWQKKELSSVN